MKPHFSIFQIFLKADQQRDRYTDQRNLSPWSTSSLSRNLIFWFFKIFWRQTNRPTDRQTDRPTDKVTYKDDYPSSKNMIPEIRWSSILGLEWIYLFFFSCDSSSIGSNVGLSVCRSVGLLVGLLVGLSVEIFYLTYLVKESFRYNSIDSMHLFLTDLHEIIWMFENNREE